MFLTSNSQNSVAITLINAKLCVNIVVVTQREKKLQCTHRGHYSNALHFTLPYQRLRGNSRGVPLLLLSDSSSPVCVCVCVCAPAQVHACDSTCLGEGMCSLSVFLVCSSIYVASDKGVAHCNYFLCFWIT